MVGKRPAETVADEAICQFLQARLGHIPDFTLAMDGENGWAFWVRDSDTTSYVHHDLAIEWYGTLAGARTCPWQERDDA